MQCWCWFCVFVVFTCTSAEMVAINYYQGVENPTAEDDGRSLNTSELYFEQRLDHFDVTDERTWTQRYWKNSTYYKVGGPIFLLISGEAPATTYWMSSGAWHVYAKHVNAMMFMLEHRYYGESRPTNDTSTENLQYLNVEQALADISHFIHAMNKEHHYREGTKWIALGGSYAGSLAVWLRMKYPHLVHATVSSSAPLVAKLDYPEFFDIIGRLVTSYSQKCAKHITRANKELESMVRSKNGRAQVTKWMKLCENLTDSSHDISMLFQNLANNLANLIQNDKTYKGGTGLATIKGVCDFLTNNTYWKRKTTSVRRYVELNKAIFNITDTDDNCLPAEFNLYYEILKITDWDVASIYGRQWQYQTCTQFGFYQTSYKRNSMFGRHIPLKYFTDGCEQLFGPEFHAKVQSRAVNRTNLMYGGLNNHVSRVIYIQGMADPWYPLGIYNTDDNGQKPYRVVVMKGTSHCADMFEPTNQDSVELKDAREQIRNTISLWVNED